MQLKKNQKDIKILLLSPLEERQELFLNHFAQELVNIGHIVMEELKM